jgi:hypothetical protein
MEPGQEWCLECGAAQTLIHRAPDWRIAVALVGAVIVIALIALGLVLANLTSTAGGTTTTVTDTVSQTVTAAAKQTFAGWPVGLGGWTVALSRARTQADANASASRLAASGLDVGVLNSSEHPSMPPGYWVVYSGRYPNSAGAQAAAARLRSAGQPAAVATQVARPGGL